MNRTNRWANTFVRMLAEWVNAGEWYLHTITRNELIYAFSLTAIPSRRMTLSIISVPSVCIIRAHTAPSREPVGLSFLFLLFSTQWVKRQKRKNGKKKLLPLLLLSSSHARSKGKKSHNNSGWCANVFRSFVFWKKKKKGTTTNTTEMGDEKQLVQLRHSHIYWIYSRQLVVLLALTAENVHRMPNVRPTTSVALHWTY